MQGEGWKCPGCGTCYAPWYPKCDTCIGDQVKITINPQCDHMWSTAGTGGKHCLLCGAPEPPPHCVYCAAPHWGDHTTNCGRPQ